MTYYVDLAVEVTCLVLDLAHHVRKTIRPFHSYQNLLF